METHPPPQFLASSSNHFSLWKKISPWQPNSKLQTQKKTLTIPAHPLDPRTSSLIPSRRFRADNFRAEVEFRSGKCRISGNLPGGDKSDVGVVGHCSRARHRPGTRNRQGVCLFLGDFFWVKTIVSMATKKRKKHTLLPILLFATLSLRTFRPSACSLVIIVNQPAWTRNDVSNPVNAVVEFVAYLGVLVGEVTVFPGALNRGDGGF